MKLNRCLKKKKTLNKHDNHVKHKVWVWLGLRGVRFMQMNASADVRIKISFFSSLPAVVKTKQAIRETEPQSKLYAMREEFS